MQDFYKPSSVDGIHSLVSKQFYPAKTFLDLGADPVEQLCVLKDLTTQIINNFGVTTACYLKEEKDMTPEV